MMKHYDYILFDYDGTVSASAEGVRYSLERTLREVGAPCPDLDDYTRYVGPPLEDTFIGLCGLDAQTMARAIPLYRTIYRTEGIYKNTLYDGIDALLDHLRAQGCRTALCTSKNETTAIGCIKRLGLEERFDAICGSSDDGLLRNKADLIPYALSALGCTDKSRAVMIGDTWFDAKGAAACGVDFIGVLYGYGTRETMAAYGAVGFADTPLMIEEILRDIG